MRRPRKTLSKSPPRSQTPKHTGRDAGFDADASAAAQGFASIAARAFRFSALVARLPFRLINWFRDRRAKKSESLTANEVNGSPRSSAGLTDVPIPIRSTSAHRSRTRPRPLGLRYRTVAIILLLFAALVAGWILCSALPVSLFAPEQPAIALEAKLAGPVTHDANSGSFLVPIHITLDGYEADESVADIIQQLRFSYTDANGSVKQPPRVIYTGAGESSNELLTEVMLPLTLAGQQVALIVVVGESGSIVPVSLVGPPEIVVTEPSSSQSEYIDELGRLRISVVGSVTVDAERYEYEWVVSAVDPAGNARVGYLSGAQGEITVELDDTQDCIDYAIKLIARSDEETMSWSQQRRACHRS